MRFKTLILAIFSLVILALANTNIVTAQSLQRQVPTKAEALQMQTMAPSGRIVVKFREDSGLVVRQEGLSGGQPADVLRFQQLLADKAGYVRLERRFSQTFEQMASLRRTGMERTHRPLPDLNAYGVLDYSGRTADRTELLSLLKAILADPAVETAFLEPVPVPAALGFDAFTGTFTAPEHDGSAEVFPQSDLRDSPDFTNYQGYLLAPPGGVNAMAVEGYPGARGADMKMVDIELGWNFNHEDLPAPFFTYGTITSPIDNRNHGTAVLGEIRGGDNGFGVRGITPDAQVGASSAYNGSVATAILRAWQAVDEGDVLLIELHAPGPAADGNGQFGYVPMEFWQDNFDTIMMVTANGAVVCEAAGNGTQNLDDPIYGSLFDRNWRDSGAIMCGATTIGGTPYSWSNNGSRVDLNGWGGNVGTCGYGDLQDTSEDVFYTAYFSGTSSASPIVTGSVMALQGMAKASYDIILDALTIRTMMAETGTPQSPGGIVGPRPDILAAFQDLEWGLGEISGTVTDAATGLPIEGVAVTVTESEQTMLTDAAGGFHFTTSAGMQEFTFSQFFYQETSSIQEIIFDQPAVLNISMTTLPTIDVRAVVRTENGAALTTGRATALGVPLTSETLPGGQGFLIAGAPIGTPLQLRFDNEPFNGVDLVSLTPVSSPTGYNFVYPELATVAHDFEFWPFNYTTLNGTWTWGIPTDPVTAFSGNQCWAMGLEGDYPPATSDYLISDSYNLSGHTETYLSFHYWCDLEDGVDGVNLQMQTYNNAWVDIEPLGGYSHARIAALGNLPGWSGNSDGWQGVVFDIQEFTDLYVKYRFKFFSDGEVEGAGFYIDDVTFDHGDSLSPVGSDEELPASARVRLSAHPNPFNPQTTIQWQITRPGPMTVQIFDTRGRLVKVLTDEYSDELQGTLVWDGRNSRAEAAASGTYLVQVKDSTGQSSTRRVTLIK